MHLSFGEWRAAGLFAITWISSITIGRLGILFLFVAMPACSMIQSEAILKGIKLGALLMVIVMLD
jgi:hypothetical protein